MNHVTNLDILVVYSEKLANSASSAEVVSSPFSKGSNNENYNLVYGFFLKNCRRNNLKAAFTTSADIIGPGRCRSYWIFENGTWIKIQKECFSELIFDKFSPRSKSRKISRNLLFSSKQIKPFNNINLFNLCFDKWKAYKALKSFSIPTVAIEGCTRQDLLKALRLLRERIAKHKNKNDFSGKVVMKNRFGAGGLNVYKFDEDETNKMSALLKKCKSTSFIIQPFVKFNKGFCFQNSVEPTDIRLIYLGEKIIQTYIRIAQKGSFICNEHAGGLLKYISKSEVPWKVKTASKKIVSMLNTKQSLFSLDFIISNGGNVYFLEANAGPGLDWNLSIKENEIEAKKLIMTIVKEIKRRIN